jgi:hypothetical protein
MAAYALKRPNASRTSDWGEQLFSGALGFVWVGRCGGRPLAIGPGKEFADNAFAVHIKIPGRHGVPATLASPKLLLGKVAVPLIRDAVRVSHVAPESDAVGAGAGKPADWAIYPRLAVFTTVLDDSHFFGCPQKIG